MPCFLMLNPKKKHSIEEQVMRLAKFLKELAKRN